MMTDMFTRSLYPQSGNAVIVPQSHKLVNLCRIRRPPILRESLEKTDVPLIVPFRVRIRMSWMGKALPGKAVGQTQEPGTSWFGQAFLGHTNATCRTPRVASEACNLRNRPSWANVHQNSI